MGNVAYVAGYRTGLATALTGLGRYAEAEALLAKAWETIVAEKVLAQIIIECISAHMTLYEAWHAAEPDGGYDSKAAAWRKALKQFQSNPSIQRPPGTRNPLLPARETP